MNLPKWNISVVLYELTKTPFKPMKDTDLKHLTLKTAFLLALASHRPFPSDQLSAERKAGAHPLQPSLQESKFQGLGICLPHQDVG